MPAGAPPFGAGPAAAGDGRRIIAVVAPADGTDRPRARFRIFKERHTRVPVRSGRAGTGPRVGGP